MIIGRWCVLVGRSYGMPVWFDGFSHVPMLAFIRDGRVWLGKGAEISIGPCAVRWMHGLYSIPFDIE